MEQPWVLPREWKERTQPSSKVTYNWRRKCGSPLGKSCWKCISPIGHQWVSALAKYDFRLEYQKGRDNAVADALSQVTTLLEPEAVQAILDGATMGAS